VSRTIPQENARRACRWLPLVLAGLLAGCSTVGYYYQSARGQLDLMCRARDIDQVLKDDEVAPELRDRLERVVEIRRFASQWLQLPDNDSYREYADLEREYAIWNVFAAPELSVEPHRWCFPIVGCVVYRGYFEEDAARRYARTLHEKDLETFVAGVPAYSTIGWFDDPVVSTVMHYPEADLAGLVFHELAHQVAYAKGDSIFNESFATAVEIEGVERWLMDQGRQEDIAAYRLRRQRDTAVVALILEYRRRLEAAYASNHDRAWKLDRKAALIAELRERYQELVAGWDGYQGYRRWFDEKLNNAHFVVIAAYHDKVGAFQALLERSGGDLAEFYETVRELADKPLDERNDYLDRIEAGAAAPAEPPPGTAEDPA
jgi:predicted aminopeptidase